MGGDPWSSDPIVGARLGRLNEAYARGEIDLDDLERRTAEVIERGHPQRAPTTSAAAAPAPARAGRASGSRFGRYLVVGVVIVAALGGLGAVASWVQQPAVVPDAVGMYPQEAIAVINGAGLRTNSHGGIHEEEGEGFVVCETVPAAGATLDPDGIVEVFSRRDCEPKSALAKAYTREWRSARRDAIDGD